MSNATNHESHISRVVSILLEHRKILEALTVRLSEAEKLINKTSENFESYIEDLHNYVKLVDTYNIRLDSLAKSFSEVVQALEPIIKGTDRNKSVLDRLERIETWIDKEIQRQENSKQTRSNLFLGTMSNLLPALMLILLTFMGSVLFDYVFSIRRDRAINELVRELEKEYLPKSELK